MSWRRCGRFISGRSIGTRLIAAGKNYDTGDAVQPVLLAILWTLDNRRIACELSKVDIHAWQLRVVANGAELRRDVFDDLALTLRRAQAWRDEFSRNVKIA